MPEKVTDANFRMPKNNKRKGQSQEAPRMAASKRMGTMFAPEGFALGKYTSHVNTISGQRAQG